MESVKVMIDVLVVQSMMQDIADRLPKPKGYKLTDADEKKFN